MPIPPPGGGQPDAAAVMTAKLVSELSDVMRAVLERHPINAKRTVEGIPLANVVLLRSHATLCPGPLWPIFKASHAQTNRGCGGRIDVPSFEIRHEMKPFCMFAPRAVHALVYWR